MALLAQACYAGQGILEIHIIKKMLLQVSNPVFFGHPMEEMVLAGAGRAWLHKIRDKEQKENRGFAFGSLEVFIFLCRLWIKSIFLRIENRGGSSNSSFACTFRSVPENNNKSCFHQRKERSAVSQQVSLQVNSIFSLFTTRSRKWSLPARACTNPVGVPVPVL